MNFFVTNLISVLSASIVAVILIRSTFKNSIFVKIGLAWLFNILFLIVTIGTKVKYFEDNTLISLSITVINIIVSVLCYSYAFINIGKPLAKAIQYLN